MQNYPRSILRPLAVGVGLDMLSLISGRTTPLAAQSPSTASADASQRSPTAALADLVRPRYSGAKAFETVAYLDQFVRWPGNRGFDASIAHDGSGGPTAIRSFVYTGAPTGMTSGDAKIEGASIKAKLPPYSISVLELTTP